MPPRPAPALPVRVRRRLQRELLFVVANARSPRATFGRGCDIRPRLQLFIEGDGRIEVGERCTIDRGAIFEAVGLLQIGDDSVLGNSVTIAAKESVVIGRHCLIADGVSIRDHDHRHDDLTQPMALQGSTSAPVVIEDDVWLGSGVFVTSGVRIGKGTIVGARAVVTRDLPAGVIAVGAPAKVVKRRGE